MEITVWNTYVEREDGHVMHFDILVPKEGTDEKSVYKYGNEYLKTKTFKTETLTSKECRFCHIEQATNEMIKAINKKGYFIIEMEFCD